MLHASPQSVHKLRRGQQELLEESRATKKDLSSAFAENEKLHKETQQQLGEARSENQKLHKETHSNQELLMEQLDEEAEAGDKERKAAQLHRKEQMEHRKNMQAAAEATAHTGANLVALAKANLVATEAGNEVGLRTEANTIDILTVVKQTSLVRRLRGLRTTAHRHAHCLHRWSAQLSARSGRKIALACADGREVTTAER